MPAHRAGICRIPRAQPACGSAAATVGANGGTYGAGRFTTVSDLTYVVRHSSVNRLEDRGGLLAFFAEEPPDTYRIKVVQWGVDYVYTHDPNDRNWEARLWRTLD